MSTFFAFQTVRRSNDTVAHTLRPTVHRHRIVARSRPCLAGHQLTRTLTVCPWAPCTPATIRCKQYENPSCFFVVHSKVIAIFLNEIRAPLLLTVDQQLCLPGSLVAGHVLGNTTVVSGVLQMSCVCVKCFIISSNPFGLRYRGEWAAVQMCPI